MTTRFPDEGNPLRKKISNGFLSLRFCDWFVCEQLYVFSLFDWSPQKRLTSKPPHGSQVSPFGGIFIVCEQNYWETFILVSTSDSQTLNFSLPQTTEALNMGAECGFQTKQQLNECILRCPWSEYPLPPVHRACRDGDTLSLTYLTIQGDKLAVSRSINDQDQFLMWTPAHWAAYFGKVSSVWKKKWRKTI